MPPQTDLFFRTAKPKSKPYKISDGGGLYMQVEPHGSDRLPLSGPIGMLV
jgi:hypothetical protein